MTWKDVGPIIAGDQSLLDEDLTHATSGLDFYPAFDAGWVAGKAVIAPERVTITRHSGGTNSGWSLYATGESGLRYYVTHLNSARAGVGSTVGKGGRLGTIGSPSDFPGARVAHAHVGVNVENLLGAGKQLRHNTNYTHGQPTIRAQLTALLPEEDEMTRERVLELRALAKKFDEGGRVLSEAPDLTDEAERAIFYTYLIGVDAGRSVTNADLRGKLSQIHDLSAP